MLKEKRESLEKFIREQLIGPGGCARRFSYIPQDQESVVKEDNAIDVVNTTPGSIYCTAVLFPKKDSLLSNDDDLDKTKGEIVDNEMESETIENQESEDDELLEEYDNIEDDEDALSLSRRFPNSFGLSCCFKEGTNFETDVKIVVKGRYYKQVCKEERKCIKIEIKENKEVFEEFWNNQIELHDFYAYKDGFLSIEKEIDKSKLKEIDKYVSSNLASGDPNYLEINEKYRYLLSYKEKTFSKQKESKDSNTSNILKEKIKKIEIFETILSYFEDLADIYDSRGYGFWRSEFFSHEIKFSETSEFDERRKIYKPTEYPCLEKFVQYEFEEKGELHKASMSAWIQLTKNERDAKDRNVYFKITVNNDSDAFRETKKDFFTIVNEKVNRRCFFGVEVCIESEKLVPFIQRNSMIEDSELKRNIFLYRSLEDYGTGHGCSVKWFPEKNASRISTDYMPTCDVPDVDVVPRSYNRFDANGTPTKLLQNDTCLQFKWLSTFSNATDDDIRSQLKNFAESYNKWINSLKKCVQQNEEIALQQIGLCTRDYERICGNLKYLDDPQNMRCFRLMNSAMFVQLWHGKESNRNKYREWLDVGHEDSPDYYRDADDRISGDMHAAWRPFQLAFILLTLDSIFEPDIEKSKRNELVDLVWFPTGGGKTEAYLGIIALTIIYRRLVSKKTGCTVIMRYTLRLLTAQQFERAMKLIFALERIRKWSKKGWHLGEEEISIGLYIGQGSLPNSKKELEEEAARWEIKDKSGKRQTSKIPLDKCPVCGHDLSWNGQKFACSNVDCPFEDGVPVCLCDELIYEKQPTLLFGTIDKFAAIAHKIDKEKKNDSRRIFSPNPPDLIIQDELHLLQGPLGTAAALFECAIDQLCTKDGKRPKIISSTATVRNAPLQIQALYDRDVNIFPKNGLSYDDSFFAFYKRTKINGEVKFESKRKYLGIMPTGRTQMTTQIRLAAILFVHRALWEKEHLDELDNPAYVKSADYYYSLISYFNSLREVGKTDAQFYLEFNKYVKRLFKRVCNPGNLIELYYANDDLTSCELTGRLTGPEVVQNLDEVSLEFDARKRGQEPLPPDFILATNMISVGIDIDRFNTMIINSMPRNLAEYIQASSRVARKELGLVITLHNPFRSRDVSHFENFKEFHEKMYFYVEPISITPFSQKSIDLYMPLVLATIVRHRFKELGGRDGASVINDKLKSEIIKLCEEYFQKRLRKCEKFNESALRNILDNDGILRLQKFVGDALDEWMEKKEPGIVYEKSPFEQKKELYVGIDEVGEIKDESKWVVPYSLRTVDPSVVIHIGLGV